MLINNDVIISKLDVHHDVQVIAVDIQYRLDKVVVVDTVQVQLVVDSHS